LALAAVGGYTPSRFLGTVLWRKARPTSTATRRANAKNSPKWRAIHSFNNKSWRSRKSGGPWRRSKRSSSAKPAGRDGVLPLRRRLTERPRGVEGCRGALAPPCKRVRQPAAPYRLVFVPTLRSIKLVLKQSHRRDLTAVARGEPTRITRRGCLPGRAARGSASPRKATCQSSGERAYLIGSRSPTRAKSTGKSSASFREDPQIDERGPLLSRRRTP
jgi:hypothetical protein